MNLQEQNRMRDKMRDLQSLVDRLAARVAELEAMVRELDARSTPRIVRKDSSRRAIL